MFNLGLQVANVYSTKRKDINCLSPKWALNAHNRVIDSQRFCVGSSSKREYWLRRKFIWKGASMFLHPVEVKRLGDVPRSRGDLDPSYVGIVWDSPLPQTQIVHLEVITTTQESGDLVIVPSCTIHGDGCSGDFPRF